MMEHASEADCAFIQGVILAALHRNGVTLPNTMPMHSAPQLANASVDVPVPHHVCRGPTQSVTSSWQHGFTCHTRSQRSCRLCHSV